MQDNKEITWPGWETVRLIGRGSFGAVYEIQRDVFGDIEKAALKVISIPQNASDIDEMYSDGYDDESITSTFQSHLKSIVAEYSLMRKMNGSANIVNCDDIRYVQHDDGIGWNIFIKMELLTPLTKALPMEIPEDTVLKIAKDMCAALELCKKFDIVHRDIKPQNIFVSDLGDYKLGDFGIAKTVEKTMGGTKIGTYKYMAPEVYNNQPYGSAADIYSLGLVLYWLLNERRMPFLPLAPAKLNATMEDSARKRRLSGEPLPPPAHGSEKLKGIALKACTYDPQKRYQTAREMLDELNNPTPKIIPSKPIADTITQSTRPKAKPLINSNKWYYTLAPVLTVIIAIFIAILVFAGISDNKYIAKHGETTSVDQNSEDSTVHAHNWAEATCTDAKMCLACGETEGSAVGHLWINATELSPKKCSACSITEGRSLGISLTKCTFLADSNEKGSKSDVNVGDWVDCFGATHYNALRFWVSNKSGWSNTEYVVYDLNEQYTEMDVCIQLAENSQEGATAYIKIYLDGQLLEASQVVGKESSAVTFTVRVGGVNQLEIECITDAAKNAYCIVDAMLFIT